MTAKYYTRLPTQADVSQLWNEMSRLLDPDSMYKATPSRPKSRSQQLQVQSSSTSPVRSPVASPSKPPARSLARSTLKASAVDDEPEPVRFLFLMTLQCLFLLTNSKLSSESKSLMPLIHTRQCSALVLMPLPLMLHDKSAGLNSGHFDFR